MGMRNLLSQPKCIKLPTFSVYDRLNISDLIHFSETDFMRVATLIQVALARTPDFVLVQTAN